MIRLLRICGLMLLVQLGRAAEDLPPIPVGMDAYRLWDQWAYQRIGMRAYMRSTYDRRGGNEAADASHFLYQLSDSLNVTLDLEGPGVLVFSRYNHWHGSPWHYIVDGIDHVIAETSTRDPLHPAPDSTFVPAAPFPSPLNWTWATTKGADLVWTPIPFERSFQMAYTRTHYGTGYYVYDRFVPGTPLSHPLRSWKASAGRDPAPPRERGSSADLGADRESVALQSSSEVSDIPAQDALNLIARSGTDISPKTRLKGISGRTDLPAHGKIALARLKRKAVVRALEFSIPVDEAAAFENAHLLVTWDGRRNPSIDAPIGLFYGTGTLYNRDKREYLVKAFPVNVRFTRGRIYLSCYFPMPFFKTARFELMASDYTVRDIEWNVRYMHLNEPANQLSYFHATYRDFPHPTLGHDLVLLDTRKTEGGGDWSGQLAGTSFIFSHDANLRTLEGDPRFFFDDSLTPQAQGTGTEEWGGGGDYWGGLNMTLPFVGHPVGARSPQLAVNDKDEIESAYRFLLADLMPFGRNAVIDLEHGGSNESTEHYETVTYWYGLPSASLVQTDTLQVGDPMSEKRHRYSSPQASDPYSITSRYEWGVDTLDDKEIYPTETDRGRTTQGASEFRLQLQSDNLGVLLRRKLDYSFANQRAEVYVADESRSGWKLAGVWYLAGSNTCVYSNAEQELGATEHILETSNRRFRDDEFLISKDLTHGRKGIWIRVKFTPVSRPLFPGYPLGEQAWSEIRYSAYCFVVPRKPE